MSAALKTAPASINLYRIPSERCSEISQALSEWKASSFYVRRTLSGHSGALALLVDIAIDHGASPYTGVAVLKLGNSEDLDRELDNYTKVRKISKEVEKCIPTIIASFKQSNSTLILMTVTAWGLLEVDPLIDLNGPSLNLGCQLSSRFLLETLNPSPQFPAAPSHLSEIIKEWVPRQTGPESRIPAFLDDFAGLPSNTDSFRYLGTDYPHPLTIASDDSRLGLIELTPCRGAFHGDLHLGNALLNRFGGEGEKTLFVIDFDSFMDNAPLFFDHAYFELSHLLSARADVTPQRWKSICDQLSDPLIVSDYSNAAHRDDVGLLLTVKMIRSPVSQWAQHRFSARTEDIKKQILAGRIAAGLNFCNKRTLVAPNEKTLNKLRFFSFIYAATAARSLALYTKNEIRSDAVAIQFKEEKPLPSTDQWKAIWEACGGFAELSVPYFLVVGGELSTETEFTLATLSRLRWKAVIDGSPLGISSRLANFGLPEARKLNSVFHALPHQVEQVDLASSSIWLATEPPIDENDQHQESLANWKARVLPTIRRVATTVYKNTAPTPITALVVGVPQKAKLLSILSALQEAAPDRVSVTWLMRAEADAPPDALRDEIGDLQSLPCQLDELALGVYQYIGDAEGQRSIMVPVRTEDGIRFDRLSEAEFVAYSAHFELFPSSMSNLGDGSSDEVDGFLQGNTITWHGLDVHADVDRDLTKAVITNLRQRLSSSPNESFAIDHTPGAGGSTVGRRIAWELRDEFPCISIGRVTTDLFDSLESLFRRTSLPILAIVEAGLVPANQRDWLFGEMKARNVRFLILDIRRRIRPANAKHTAALRDPMTFQEAKRFLALYAPRAHQRNRNNLAKLASERAEDSSHTDYRSPFFFGLYAFERDFLKVDSYVNSILQEASEPARKLICDISLVTRYSQERLPIATVNTLAGIASGSSKKELDDLVGRPASKLLVTDGRSVGIKHPLLAEAVLKQELQPSGNSNPDAWRGPLNDLCVRFVREIVAKGLAENTQVLEILYDLFLERQTSSGSTKQHFSELMDEFKSSQGEKIVLECLCEEFPDNPHFLSHLARNINYRKTGSFDEARQLAEKAISIDDQDSDVFHILGMIYRFEIERTLGTFDSLTDLDLVISAIDGLFSAAVNAFRRAQDLRRDDTFPIITPIQMSLYVLGSVFSLSGSSSFIHFIQGPSGAAAWCRGKLDYADSLFDTLHQLEANGQPSQRRVFCDSDRAKLIGNIGGMLEQLRALLGRFDVVKAPVRRLISGAHLKRLENSEALDMRGIREVCALSEDNLRDNPGSIVDLRNWIRSYRMLPNFSIAQALDRITRASLVSDHIEPIYYLMVVNFMAYRMGIGSGLLEAKKHLETCKRKSSAIISKKSFEWVSSSSLKRPLQLVHHSELGDWSKTEDFFLRRHKLEKLEGRIDEIRSPQAGTISFNGMPAFFTPRSEFRKVSDTNIAVLAYVGFSYEGLRAWSVERL